MSSASAPRTSPTTMRSGRMRSVGAHELAHRHRARALGVRRPGLEPHDVRLLEPQLGGLLDGDDRARRSGIAADSAFSSVVFPALVPPDTTTFQPAATAHRRNAAQPSPGAKASSGTGRAANRRIVTHGPSIASGGITACSRDPSASRASTIGDARSRRRPSGATTRSTSRTMPRRRGRARTGSTRPARST